MSSRLQRQRLDAATRALRVVALVLVIVAGLTTLGVASARAQSFDADEARDLRIVKSGADVALTWVAPPTAPADYIVRRCTLAALRGGTFGAPYFGNCVATGVLPTNWSEPSPLGSVFYLVSGQTGGVEGSLGSSWNGQSFVPRPPTDCGSPEMPMPLTLVISLDTPQLVCGTQLTLFFAPEDLVFVGGQCTGVQAGFFGASNGTLPGRVSHACASATGFFGSGEIARLDFQRGECPVGPTAFHFTQCDVLVGNPDCGTTILVPETCILDVQ